MKQGFFGKVILLAACASLAPFGCSMEDPADLILQGAKVYTLYLDSPVAEAVAVKGDVIVYVGSSEGCKRFRGPKTTVLSLDGSVMLPGLTDSHAHLMGLGRALFELDLAGTASPREIRKMVLEERGRSRGGTWITGRGWDQNDWEVKEFPSWKDLEGTEGNPVCLRRIDGHALWVNRTVLELCGITRETPDPAGGKIVRNEEGEPTGVLIDNAIDLVEARMPKPSFAEMLSWAKRAQGECNRLGLVGVHDAGVDSLALEVYRELQRRGELSLRVYAMLSAEDEAFLRKRLQMGPTAEAGRRLVVRSVKIYADGALGSRGAALLEPYSDEPTNRGLLISSPEALYRLTKMAIGSGFQVCTHAIGDAAIRAALDAYERALGDFSPSDHRLRIEHCQVIAPEDLPRFAELGVIASVQPTHATSDMDWAEDRLGPERIKGAYAWRSLIESGCRIACGSDFPVESANPFWGIYAAVTRKDRSGSPEGGWYPQERITIEEVLRGFTLNASYASFAEGFGGSIEVGKLADLIIVDRDIFSVPPEEILSTRVLYTVVGGEIVYSAR